MMRCDYHTIHNKDQNMNIWFLLEKRILFFLVIFITQLLFSYSANARLSLGIRGGGAQVFSKVDTDYSKSDGAISGNHKNSTDMASRGFMGGITLEEGAYLSDKKFYMGIVAGLNFYSVRGKDFRTVDSPMLPIGGKIKNNIDLRKRYSFDISAKFGYQLTESTLSYLKLGVSVSKYELTSHIFTSDVVGVGFVDNSRTFKKHFLSFKPAVGIEVAMSKNMSLGIEYSHEISEKKTFTQNYDPVGNVPVQELPHVLRPQTGTIALFLSYKI